MDERKKLLDELSVLLPPSTTAPVVHQLKNDIICILDKYEVAKSCTEVGPVFTDQNEALLKRFLIAKTVKGCSPRTIQYYQVDIRRFLNRVKKNIGDITPEDIRMDSALRLRRDGVTKVTAANEHRNLSSFFGWLAAEELIQKNPMKKVDPIKREKTQKEAFTDYEIEELRAAANGKREKMILEVLLSTGCRVSELVQIQVSDLDFDENRALVHGKGNKDRWVYLNAKAVYAVKSYLADRKDMNPYLLPRMKSIGATSKVKVSQRTYCDWWMNPENVENDGHTDKSSLEGITRRMAKRAGVQRANPHKFRRTCATMALRRGMPIEQVSKMLGHEQISTTQIYLDLSEEDLRRSHKTYVV